MNIRKFLLFAFFVLAGYSSHGQELKVVSFQRLERDLIARTSERKDLNGVPCAVVRVAVRDAQAYFFRGNVMGDVVYNPGEALVYMPDGSRSLTITSDKFGTLRYEFPEHLEKQAAYRLSLRHVESDDNKRRTLVMPVMGIGKDMSYGIMVGLVRKTGFYVKAKYNFQSVSADYECNADGYVPEAGGIPWYNGQSQSSRLAVTAGVLHRLSKPLYLYAGAGFGSRTLGWQLNDGKWVRNADKSSSGVEADLGGILRIKNISLSLGVQSNQFKYWEGSLGVGIMF